MIKTGFSILVLSLAGLAVATHSQLRPIPDGLDSGQAAIQKPQLLDRNLTPITITYKNDWNLHDLVALHQIPEFLQQAFITSEDKRFYQHHGVDWTARFHALWQNLRSLHNLRGASTITEQTIKMLHPRPRTLWTRWLEGFEAAQLEKRYSKSEILAFYLNQVPCSAQRRGVVQAARYYFGRDLQTLNKVEMLTLAVLIRAPSRLDPIRHPAAARPAVEQLARRLNVAIAWPEAVYSQPAGEQPVNASHFAKFIYDQSTNNEKIIHTTLDLHLQNTTQQILEQRLTDLKHSRVRNGAVLVVDHQTREILSWVVAGDGDPQWPGAAIDAVITARQPGSTLKPLLYTLALENGFTAASLIDDSPLRESVGVGQHTYHNYSHQHYGLITLREALGNSLNIPAIKVLQTVGTENFLKNLKKLGIKSLDQHPNLYGDGLALGNGEITLFELVQAYTTLARHGVYQPLIYSYSSRSANKSRIFTTEATSIIASILSDPDARKLEFGRGGSLNLPVQTAIKTGTSNDYRDAWAVGFNHRYTVGVWMGNMDRESMLSITGSTGPAMVLRSIFAELNKHQQTQGLYLSPKLVSAEICKESGQVKRADDETCTPVNEWFIAGREPEFGQHVPITDHKIRIQQPGPNLQLAMDPRIPDDKELFRFSLNGVTTQKVKWFLNDQLIALTTQPVYDWQLQRGQHQLQAEIRLNEVITRTEKVNFLVK